MASTKRTRFGIWGMALALLAPLAVATADTPGPERALWLRAAAISPDGRTVAFSYRGDLWSVPATGGAATPLTVHAAHDTAPVWSPDGRQIAFASDRYGNFDVFVMPAAGGEARRLTFHSADDTPTSFTPDGKAVLFSSARLDGATNVQFPTGAQPELYRVDLAGGMPVQVLSTPALYAVWDKAGERLAYSDQKGYEMEWRKHDNSSFARDVWVWERATNTHRRLTAAGVDDRQPVWAPGERALYYLSEKSGSFNVWRLDLADPGRPVQVTTHAVHPVRFLSVSAARRPLLHLRRRDLGPPGRRHREPQARGDGRRRPARPRRRAGRRLGRGHRVRALARTARRWPSSRAARSSSPRSSTARPAASPTPPARSAP